jgi:uncharacterized protein (TIGR03435 family)
VGSEKFTIEAKAETPQTEAMMRGPMKQKLLEDRFQLRIRHQTRDGFLAVAKGGPKLKPPVNGKCRTKDEDPNSAQKLPEMRLLCAQENRGIDTFGQTIAGLCDQFSAELDRNVIEKTGIAGESKFISRFLKSRLRRHPKSSLRPSRPRFASLDCVSKQARLRMISLSLNTWSGPRSISRQRSLTSYFVRRR